MKYNIFITGRSSSGKSELARWLTRGFNQEWAGYEILESGSCEAGPLYSLYSMPGGEEGSICRFSEGKILPEKDTFETIGAKALRDARTGDAGIVMMDGIGRFESDCPQFVTELYKALSSEKTVIGVVKKEHLGKLERLKTVHNALWVDLDACSLAEARKKLAELLWPERMLHYDMDLRLYGVNKSFDNEAMRLLQGIECTGSLHQAADQMGMEGTAARELLERLEKEWGAALAQRDSEENEDEFYLTGEGAELLIRYGKMLEKAEEAVRQAFEEVFDWEYFF